MNKLTLISKIRTAADRCLSRLVRLRREPIAHREAVRLAQVMWRRSYRDVAPHWKPLADTAGVISQIANMHAGVLEDNEKMRTAALRFAATVVMLNRRAMLTPPESDKFEQACAELNHALLLNNQLRNGDGVAALKP